VARKMMVTHKTNDTLAAYRSTIYEELYGSLASSKLRTCQLKRTVMCVLQHATISMFFEESVCLLLYVHAFHM
jgi:hypothetical protein